MYVASITSGRLHDSSCAFVGWLDETAIAGADLAVMARFANAVCGACRPVSPDEWRRVRAAVPFHRSRGVRARLARQYPRLRAAGAQARAQMAPEVAPRGPIKGRRLRPVQAATADPVTARLVEAASAATREPGATEIACLMADIRYSRDYRERGILLDSLWHAVEAWRMAAISDGVELARALNPAAG